MLDNGIQTKAIHAGESPNERTGASAPDIVMSSTFVVDEPISFSANNLTEETPFIYTRWSNPTTQQLETKVSVLEKAEASVAFASGMAASASVLMSFLSSGDHLVIINTNYPGTAELARNTLTRMGIEVTTVDSSDSQQIESAMQSNTKMVWIETPSNPLLRITDIAKTAEIAHQHDALLAVDSTFATPIATRPIELGADLVVHSLTKYLGGHGDAMGGSVSGNQELVGRLREEGAAHYGGIISPFNAWLIMRGVATLPIRMKSHAENAMQVATFLEKHPKVDRVFYPGLASHPQHELASRQMDNFSGMLSFKVQNPHDTAARMMKELEVFHYAVSLGHHRSLIYLMETKDLIDSSYQLEGKELEKYQTSAGEGIFRTSIGLEDPHDLINDLDRVL